MAISNGLGSLPWFFLGVLFSLSEDAFADFPKCPGKR